MFKNKIVVYNGKRFFVVEKTKGIFSRLVGLKRKVIIWVIKKSCAVVEISDIVSELVDKKPVVMNITVTSDIVEYNELESSEFFRDNKIRNVSGKQSFVYSPSNVFYVR